MILTSITHYLDSNTLEAVWMQEVYDAEGQLVGYERAKCHSYSAPQRGQFIEDTGCGGYADLAGWPAD
jgi:hypothetical protein